MKREKEKGGLKALPARPSGVAACASLPVGLTDEEVALLLRKRALAEELRALRRENLSPSDLEARAGPIASELKRLEGLIAEARTRRMVLLGHREP